MAEWSGGYVTEVTYPYSYRADMNPVRIRALLTLAGYEVPEGSVVCELGFGQGVAINIHAVSQPDSVQVGTDFSPAQTGFARSLQQQSGAQMLLVDQAFADFCARDDLPEFDFIVAHGIWSWVSEENRQHIEGFVARRLKVGGAFVFSYNAMPGWSAFLPVRDLMLRHADRQLPAAMPITQKLDQAMGFLQQLMQVPASSVCALQNPLVDARLQQMRLQEPNHLVHEYFNRDWQPMSFPQVAERMSAIKLDFACSANPAKHLPAMNFTAEQLQAVAQIHDPLLAEYARDVFANTDFRVDIWLKGKRPLSGMRHANALSALRFVLVADREARVAWVTPRGEAEPDPSSYQAVRALLADYQPRSLQEIHAQTTVAGGSFADTLNAIKLLWAANVVAPAQTSTQIEAVQPAVSAFNQYLIQQAISDAQMTWLASAVTGGAIAASRRELLMLLAVRLGMGQAEAMASFVAEVEQSSDPSGQCQVAEVQAFLQQRYPALQALCGV